MASLPCMLNKQERWEWKPSLARRVAKTIMLVRSISSLTGVSCGATDDIATTMIADFSLPNQIHFTTCFGVNHLKILSTKSTVAVWLCMETTDCD